MSNLSAHTLAHPSTTIMGILFIYRGLTAAQITKCLYGEQLSLSHEKSVYNYLIELSQAGFITSHRLQGTYFRESFFFLTLRGYGLAKEVFNILEGKLGSGWIKADIPFEDIPYPIYRPPLVQASYHLLLIDFFIQVEGLKEIQVDYSLNLYAYNSYQVKNEKFCFQPGAEIKFFDGRRFAIETAFGDESQSQFCKEFQVYKKYFDHLTENSEELPDGILFVLPDNISDHGIKQGWINIATAFFKEMGPYHTRVNLIMTTLSKVQETLQFEDERMQNEIKCGRKIYNQLSRNNNNVHAYARPIGNIQENAFMYVVKNTKYEVNLNAVCQEFETRIYSRFIFNSDTVLGKCKTHEVIEDLEYETFKINVFFSGQKPFIISRPLDKTFELSEQLSRACEILNNEAEFLNLKEMID